VVRYNIGSNIGQLAEGIGMCLGIPMRIVEIDGFNARCEAKGVERDVSLFMLQDEGLAPDDYVVVHVGYAIQKITPREARSAWEIYDELLAGEPG
jgi:hydrogenase expression/formation protein HypC